MQNIKQLKEAKLYRPQANVLASFIVPIEYGKLISNASTR